NKQNEHDLPSTNVQQDSQELTVFVQSLLEQMQSRFAQMSEAIIGRNILFNAVVLLDEMGTRIDDLEKSIGELMEQSATEGKPAAPKE
ncbi:hypothetical protein THRCLA_20438, partial [Thraustotheca clavata]